MKKTIAMLSLMGLMVLPAIAEDKNMKEADRVEAAGHVISEIMNVPDDIPQSVIDKADCVVVLPSVLKAAFIVGGSYGRGVMTCRSGHDFHGRWSAPTMMALEGASFGFQLGGQATDFVLLLMTPQVRSQHSQQQGEDRRRCFRSGWSGGTQCIRRNRHHPARRDPVVLPCTWPVCRRLTLRFHPAPGQ